MKFWIARNENGTLTLFLIRPCLCYDASGCYWMGETPILLKPDEFQNIKFENSPQEIESDIN
jgi:hypothetical protein